MRSGFWYCCRADGNVSHKLSRVGHDIRNDIGTERDEIFIGLFGGVIYGLYESSSDVIEDESQSKRST